MPKRSKCLYRRTVPRHGVGWFIQIARSGTVYQKMFGDRRYGGSSKARKAAEDYLEILRAILPERQKIRQKNRRNKTGMVGVFPMRNRSRNGTVTDYYAACWPNSRLGTTRRKFSMEKYGKGEAYRLAVTARIEGVRQLLREQKRISLGHR